MMMEPQEIRFKNCAALLLENEFLQAVILPEIGGKVASLYHKGKDFELLFQHQEKAYRRPGLYDAFADYDAAGCDDAFPSIDAGIVKIGAKTVNYPDHGEIWSASFRRLPGEGLLRLAYTGCVLDYKYEKTFTLDDEGLRIAYHIHNMGSEPLPAIWALHCLIRCEEDMELFFPAGVSRVRNVQQSSLLGAVGQRHSFPVTRTMSGERYHLDRILPAATGHTEKYYVEEPIAVGRCGAYYPSRDMSYCLEFNPQELPYLGFWVTAGGFRGDYNCAFEPTNGFYDSVGIAAREGRLGMLAPAASWKFTLGLGLIPGRWRGWS